MKININIIGIFTLIVLSFSAWIISYNLGYSLAYNDAMSHLNLTRMIVDNKTPGLAQMGGVWLPANRLLSLPFIWNDFLYRSGLAGSIVSMAAYVGTVITLFFITLSLTGKKYAAYVTAIVAALNINFLYLQTTPLTEPLYIFFFTLSIYTYVLWYKTEKISYLFALAATGFLQVLTRYDGWFVVIATSFVIMLTEILAKKSRYETIGKSIVYTLPAIGGVILWLAWCALIFNNPFYFTQSEFSAKSQQEVLVKYGGLITKGNIPVSIHAYSVAVYENIGLYIITVSALGFLFIFRNYDKRGIFLTLVIAISPLIFNVITLVLGITFINVPQINWNPYNLEGEQWFNVRYGSLAIPLSALLLGYIVAAKKSYSYLAYLFLGIQIVETLFHSPAVLKDGLIGASAFKNQGISQAIKSNIKNDESVLLSIAYYSPVAFKSDISLSQIIHEGTDKLWTESLSSPTLHADWIVLPKTNLSETPYAPLAELKEQNWENDYQLVYEDNANKLYQKKIIATVE